MRRLPSLAAAGLALAAAGAAPAQDAPAAGPAARGEYLVHHVAMCVQCHTPRDARGELDRSRLLQGAPVPVAAPYPNQPWALAAPSLAGLAPWTEEQVVALLTTGARPTGERPRAPMPPFRMSREDAEAVVAYLETLR
jgi:mono/diheme cytochrome c family protein